VRKRWKRCSLGAQQSRASDFCRIVCFLIVSSAQKDREKTGVWSSYSSYRVLNVCLCMHVCMYAFVRAILC
jgi:hypothetical protein